MTQRKGHSADDVVIVGISGGHHGGRRKPLTKASRKQEFRWESVQLRHVPTGREGVIEIPPGHYSRREMQRLREEAKEKFLETLS